MIAATSAETPALMCTTVPPAKSSAPLGKETGGVEASTGDVGGTRPPPTMCAIGR